MPPQLAALFCAAFVAYVFFVEKKDSADTSGALWIPLIWMFFAGSRYLSRWLNLGATMDAVEAYQEGSAVDRIVFASLIAVGVLVLLRRNLSLRQLVARNKWVCIYFAFSLLSIAWSDYSFVSFKRLIRGSGNIVMALVILTEKDPYWAVAVVMRRLAFLTLPLSVLFIKYFPEMGRAYHMGLPMFTGVALHKNTLGQVCMLTGISFCWSLLYRPEKRLTVGGSLKLPLEVVFLAIIVWLMSTVDSATSFACLLIGVSIFVLGRVPLVARKPYRIFNLAVALTLSFVVLQQTFDVRGIMIQSLGRRPDLTTRVPMWEDLLSVAPNPLIGAGYDIFWATPPGLLMAGRWEVAQAHNGYLELYLSVGLVGLVLTAGAFLSGLLKIRRDLALQYAPSILRMSFVPIVALYNWTEATFSGVSNMWLVFFLGIINVEGLVPPAPASIRNQRERPKEFHAMSLRQRYRTRE